MTRAWAVGDRVAIRDHVGKPCHLGEIIAIRPDGRLAIRGDTVTGTIRHPDDVRVIPEREVPVDERHWLNQDERDQLVRHEAAGRLRAMAVALDHDDALLGLASLLADVVGAGGGGWLPTGGSWASTADLARSARSLLAPAPAPAPTPH